MAKKAKTRTNWQRKLFLKACRELKPLADQYFANDMEIDGMVVGDAMWHLILCDKHAGIAAATAIASAWHYLLTPEDIRCEISQASENSVGSEYFLALYWLGTFHSLHCRRDPSSSKPKRTKRGRK